VKQLVFNIVLLGLLDFHSSLLAQGNFPFTQAENNSDTSQQQDTVVPLRVVLVTGAAAGVLVLAHVQNYNSWWKGTRSDFHFGEDGTYAIGADKLGHFLFTYYSSDILGRSLAWAGIPHERALLYGGSAALAFQLYVEVEDGFHPELGFSVQDGIANFAGAVYPFLQYHSNIFRAISPKWSVLPSQKYRQGKFRTLIDDYESQYYWLSVNIHDIFRDKTPSFIPSFLNIAFGYGVKNLDGKGGGEKELYIGLDCDFTKLPGSGSFLNTLKHVLNYLHCPAPTVRVTPHVVVYGVRF
jgi:hypothetical protein